MNRLPVWVNYAPKNSCNDNNPSDLKLKLKKSRRQFDIWPKSNFLMKTNLDTLIPSWLRYFGTSIQNNTYLSQKSLCNGRSIFFNSSLVEASIETYNWVTGFNIFIASGNWALVTMKDEISFECNKSTYLLISGYIMGSPTKDRAQCLT